MKSCSGAPHRSGRLVLRRALGVLVGALVAYAAWGGPRLPPNPTPRSYPAVPAKGLESAPTAGVLAWTTALGSQTSPAESIIGGAPGINPRPVEDTSDSCPLGMVLVDGEYCTLVEHTCRHWLDDANLPFARCGEYEPTARCVGQRQAMRYCIDRFEYTPAGERLPQNYASFVEASAVCDRLGKRICTESEWNFACEGPEMLPYPYGFARQPLCNQDRSDLYEPNPNRQILSDRRLPSGSMPGCKSPFGVYDMTGNLDEPVLRESQRYAYPFRNGLKGGWWMPARNRCRPATTAHDDHYHDIQVGIRCCRDAESRGKPTSRSSG